MKMTAHPAIARFRHLHRRLTIARAVRDGSIGLALGLLAGGLISRFGATAWVVMAVAGTGAGVAWALVRAPRAAAAARLLDARLGLADRLITALDVSTQQDPMAQLVLDDTWERIAKAPLHAVVPMRAVAALSRVAVAAIVALIVALPGLNPRTVPESSGSTAPVAGTATDSADAAQQAPTAKAPPTAAAESARTVTTPGGTGYLPPREKSESREGSNPDPVPAPVAGRAPGATGAEAARPQTAGGPGAGRGTGLSTGSAAPGQAETSTPAGTSVPATAGPAGLVQRAEAALDRAQVPPGLRRYVMNYFLAITAEPRR